MNEKMLDSDALESSSFGSSPILVVVVVVVLVVVGSVGKKFFSNSPLSVKYVRSKTDVPGVIVSCWKNFQEHQQTVCPQKTN